MFEYFQEYFPVLPFQCNEMQRREICGIFISNENVIMADVGTRTGGSMDGGSKVGSKVWWLRWQLSPLAWSISIFTTFQLDFSLDGNPKSGQFWQNWICQVVGQHLTCGLWNRAAIHHLGVQLEEVDWRSRCQIWRQLSLKLIWRDQPACDKPSVKYAVGKWLGNLYFYYFSFGFLSRGWMYFWFGESSQQRRGTKQI